MRDGNHARFNDNSGIGQEHIVKNTNVMLNWTLFQDGSNIFDVIFILML